MNSSEEPQRRLPPMWTIYDHPRDYPDRYVVRVWYGLMPVAPAFSFDSLSDARDFIAETGGCVNLGRAPRDDPCIIETWI